MINDLKLAFKIIPYGLNFKGNIFSFLLFFVLGLVMEISTPDMGLGGLYVGMGSLLVVQLIHSVCVSTMVQTSPYKKRLQTVIPSIIGGGYLLIANTVTMIAKWIGFQHNNNVGYGIRFEGEGAFSNAVVLSSCMMIVVMLYMGVALKCFWPATVIFFIVFVGLYAITIVSVTRGGVSVVALPVEVAIVLSYVAILIGTLCMYWIFKAMYKMEYSKITFDAALKRVK